MVQIEAICFPLWALKSQITILKIQTKSIRLRWTNEQNIYIIYKDIWRSFYLFRNLKFGHLNILVICILVLGIFMSA